MSERKRVASPQWPEVDETEPYDWRSYGAGVSFGRKQALQEIRDRGDVVISRELLGRLGDYAAHATAHEETDPPHPQLALTDIGVVEELLGDDDV